MTAFKRSCRTCGWSGTYDSPERADYSKSRHSCEKHLAKAAAAERRAQRAAAVDRTPKPCLHKIAQHEHGTYACYVLDRCRCTPCSEANSTYENQRTKRHAYGRFDTFVDAGPARDRVRELMAAGVGLKTIAKRSELPHGTLWKLVYGKKKADGSQTPSRRVTQNTADRLLALDPKDQTLLADGARIDSTGTARRIQALVAIGWSMSRIAEQLGILRSNFTDVAHGRTDVTMATARAARELYEAWSMRVPPESTHREKISASRARNLARAYGWAPPLAWDDEAIDDPSATPHTDAFEDRRDRADVQLDTVAIDRALEGDRNVRLSVAEKQEAIERGRASGLSLKEIELRTGWKADRYLRRPAQAS